MRHITDLDSGRIIEADRQISDPSELPKLTASRQVRSREGYSHLSEFVLFTLGASMHEWKIKVLNKKHSKASMRECKTLKRKHSKASMRECQQNFT